MNFGPAEQDADRIFSEVQNTAEIEQAKVRHDFATDQALRERMTAKSEWTWGWLRPTVGNATKGHANYDPNLAIAPKNRTWGQGLEAGFFSGLRILGNVVKGAAGFVANTAKSLVCDKAGNFSLYQCAKTAAVVGLCVAAVVAAPLVLPVAAATLLPTALTLVGGAFAAYAGSKALVNGFCAAKNFLAGEYQIAEAQAYDLGGNLAETATAVYGTVLAGRALATARAAAVAPTAVPVAAVVPTAAPVAAVVPTAAPVAAIVPTAAPVAAVVPTAAAPTWGSRMASIWQTVRHPIQTTRASGQTLKTKLTTIIDSVPADQAGIQSLAKQTLSHPRTKATLAFVGEGTSLAWQNKKMLAVVGSNAFEQLSPRYSDPHPTLEAMRTSGSTIWGAPATPVMYQPDHYGGQAPAAGANGNIDYGDIAIEEDEDHDDM